MKILLDAPEHLWRLIERKKYLSAAWLFLLARVVYQALMRNDDADEQSWISEGIDVSVRVTFTQTQASKEIFQAEFPLVQRQWEVVSQFRPQIIHKSTLFLREASISTEVRITVFGLRIFLIINSDRTPVQFLSHCTS